MTHILVAGELVAAAKAGDDAGVQAHRDRWYANADEIAEGIITQFPARFAT